jgi:ribosomal protein S1
VGNEVTGEVITVADFGAFVKLEEGIEGLIYSSDLSTERIDNPNEVVKEGETVTALVTRVDPIEQKISLSIRALTDKEQRDALKKIAVQQSQTQTTTLGDLLAEKLAQQTDGEESQEQAQEVEAKEEGEE